MPRPSAAPCTRRLLRTCPASRPARSRPGSFTQSLRFDPYNTSDFSGFIATMNGAAEPGAVLHGVRHQRERDDYRRGAGGRASLQQHGRQPERPGELLPHCADAGRRAGLQGRRHRRSSSRTRSGWTSSRSTWACALSSGSTSPAKARRSSPSTGRSRRGCRAIYDVLGRRPPEGVRLLRPLLRSDPHEHDGVCGQHQRPHARRAGLRQQPVGDLPHPRRHGGAGRVHRADHQDAVHGRHRRSDIRRTSAAR